MSRLYHKASENYDDPFYWVPEECFDNEDHRHSFEVAFNTLNNLADTSELYSYMFSELMDRDFEPLYEITEWEYFHADKDFKDWLDEGGNPLRLGSKGNHHKKAEIYEFPPERFDSPEHRRSFSVALNAIDSLRWSQGMYSRLWADMLEMGFEPLIDIARDVDFKDTLDFVMWYECGTMPTASKRSAKTRKRADWRGNPNIQMEYYNDWSDPSLIYNGYRFNYWDIENALWEIFLEDNGMDEPMTSDGYSIKPLYEDMFDKYVQDYGTDYLDDFIWGGYFEGDSKDWRDRYSSKNRSARRIKESKRVKTAKRRAMARKRLAMRKQAASLDYRIFIGAIPAPAIGEWVDLPCDPSEIDAAIQRTLDEYNSEYNREDYPLEEIMIPDYEGNFGMSAAEMEWADPYELNKLVERLESTYYPAEVIDCVIDLCSDLEEAADTLENGDVFYIKADDDYDLAYNYIEEMGGIGILDKDELERYFDYEAYGRDLSFSMTQGDGVYVEVI